MTHYPLVTLVGGAGFVGRHTVKLFAAQGWRVRVLSRDTIAADFVKTAGYPGQIIVQYADITKPETLVGKFAGSDAVVNLVSILAESGRQTFRAINVDGAKLVAEAAALAQVKTLVHISALSVGATHAHYAASKKAGEEAVRAAFPNVVVLRPSLIVGPEDGFFQRFARMSMIAPFLPLIGGGHTKFQPVLVNDVAQAIVTAATDSKCAGKTYELAGDEVFSFHQLLEHMARITKRVRPFIRIPKPIAAVMGSICDMLPLPPFITRDQVRMLDADSVMQQGALGLRHMGIAPRALDAALPELLARYMKE